METKRFFTKGNVYRGSPIGFSGSGIWRIFRPGIGILEENLSEIRDCYNERDAKFSDITNRDSGNVTLMNRDFRELR